jgi:hypothetical protein
MSEVQPAAPAAPATSSPGPAPIVPATRQSAPTPIVPARPAARAADPAPAARPAPPPASPPPAPAEPSTLERFNQTPQQRYAEQQARLAEGDVFRTAGVLTKDDQGRYHIDGKPVGGQADPATGEPPPAPESPDEPRYRFGDAPDAPELTAAQIKETRAHMAAEQSRKAQVPPDPSMYRATLPESWTPPPAFKDYKVDDTHPIFGQAREFAFRHGLDQAAFSEMLALSASREIGTAQMLQRARDAEIAKLGTAGTARVSAIENFLISKVGAETYKKVAPLLATEAAVRVYETWMRESLSGGVGSSFSGQRSSPRTEKLSDAEVGRMSYSDQKAYAARFSDR